MTHQFTLLDVCNQGHVFNIWWIWRGIEILTDFIMQLVALVKGGIVRPLHLPLPGGQTLFLSFYLSSCPFSLCFILSVVAAE